MTYLGAATRSLLEPDAPSPLPALAKPMAELMARALVSARPPRARKASLNRQRQLIRKTEDFCAYRTDQPLRIGELCRGIGASDRTLRDTFHKLAGMSPLAYLKIERLNLAYRALLGADPAEVLIKRVAYNLGFGHLGHFTRDYKQLFGELPSETLQRCEPGNRLHV